MRFSPNSILDPKSSGKHPENEQNGEMSSRGGIFGGGGGRNSRGRGRGNFNRNSGEVGLLQRCKICKRSSHVEEDSWFKGKKQCYNYKKFGHVKKDCRFKNA